LVVEKHRLNFNEKGGKLWKNKHNFKLKPGILEKKLEQLKKWKLIEAFEVTSHDIRLSLKRFDVFCSNIELLD
jgi:hypothetical protein